MKYTYKTFLILSLVVLSSFCSFLYAQNGEGYFLHTVERGQGLYSISSMYGVSQDDIIKLNPGAEQKIYAGQTLKIPQRTKKQFHTIKQGETLYILTKEYGVSAKDICDANPGLSAENFKIGQVIIIPQVTLPVQEQVLPSVEPSIQPPVKPRCKDMHKVKRKETIFSVSRKYGITESELILANPELKKGMKKGSFLCIPYPKTEEESQPLQPQESEYIIPPSDLELFKKNEEKHHKLSTLKAAVILPFMLDGGSKGEASRMIEYYEGFLIAVDSLKREGVSIDIHTYDSGNEKQSINHLLNKKELKEVDIIFGPLYQEHIAPLAQFTKENNIRLVIPFTSQNNEVFTNPSVYQINTPQSYLYSEVYEHFSRQFGRENIIIIDSKTTERSKDEFIKGLKLDLQAKGIPVKTLPIDASIEQYRAVLKKDLINIFIPSSGSDLTLNKLIPQLKLINLSNESDKELANNPSYAISLFGYPEWQTYTDNHLNSFFELDTYFYSSFYTNDLFPAAKHFTAGYHRWYEKEMANTHPKFGMLGFDTAFFFLKGLATYGTALEENLTKVRPTPIQTGFKFERVNNWGGFINKKVFFVHFTKGFELVKLDFD